MKPIIVNADDRHPLQSMLSILTDVEARVLSLRYHHRMTQAEVARSMETYQQNVARIESGALVKLRGARNFLVEFV